jgi:hypothetical protein
MRAGLGGADSGGTAFCGASGPNGVGAGSILDGTGPDGQQPEPQLGPQSPSIGPSQQEPQEPQEPQGSQQPGAPHSLPGRTR